MGNISKHGRGDYRNLVLAGRTVVAFFFAWQASGCLFWVPTCKKIPLDLIKTNKKGQAMQQKDFLGTGPYKIK